MDEAVEQTTRDGPRVSYICPTYNYGRFIARAVDSLLSQSFESIEVIVIDDASSDDTQSVLARYEGDRRVRTITHTENKGHIRTYNEGIALAQGEFIGIMSADDYCSDNRAVACAVALFDEYPQVGMVYFAHAVVRDGTTLKVVQSWPSDRVSSGVDEFRRLMWGNDILHSGTLLRREVQTNIGDYNENLTQTGDWSLWLRVAARYDIGYISDPMFAYRIHGANMQKDGIRPAVQVEQNVVTLEQAFSDLPLNAPPEILANRKAALRHALLQTVYFDLFNGNCRRAWIGTQCAVWRRPSVCLSGEFLRLVARLAFSTVFGSSRYRRVFG